MNRKTLFDEENRLEILSNLGDPLERISTSIDFEKFRRRIESAFEQVDYSQGGRPVIDRLLLFKILILQEYYNLSDDKVEFQINDRLTFMRFLGLGIGQKSPDAKTIWAFRDQLTKKGILPELFEDFTKGLLKLGLVAHKGSIVDATIVKAPVQRNSKEENEEIKGGKTPETWSENKTRQKDTDASWTRKRNVNFFGYKNHIKIDRKSKLITKCIVSTACHHDQDFIEDLLTKSDKGKKVWGDAAYSSSEMLEKIRKKGAIPAITKKGYKNKRLTNADIKRNHLLSKIRCRVEHIFGFIKQTAGAISVRCRSLQRATTSIIIKNLVYNIFRVTQIQNRPKMA
ncbi:MAG: IS5 family transposase [Gloeobacteraceae cyanobacterium ES-bin-316]|nr:IS5 family transposase [Ferruginibacter sp.]